MTDKRDTIADIWTAVGKIKNPFPDKVDPHSVMSNQIVGKRKGFTKAKRIVRELLWKMLMEEDRIEYQARKRSAP